MSEHNSQAGDVQAGDLGRLVGHLAHLVARALSPGDVAQLRRMTEADPHCPAFWRIAATALEPAGALPQGALRDEAERRWAVLLNAMALGADLHAPRAPLGRALAQAGYSDLRFVRLLRARGSAFADAARSAARYLAAKATPFDFRDFARLVLSEGRADEETVRRRIARTYYQAETHPE